MAQEPKGLREASVPDRVGRTGLDVLQRKRTRWSQREPGGVQRGALLRSNATNTQGEKLHSVLQGDGTLKNKHLKGKNRKGLEKLF